MKFEEIIGEDITGSICERQSTFVSFRDISTDKIFRIDYDGKKEFLIKTAEFTGIYLVYEHPLLEEYEYTDTCIYISSFVPEKELEEVEKDLLLGISVAYNGWRKPENYMNRLCRIEEILKSGYGLLYKGPPSGAKAVMEVLDRYRVSYTMPYKGSLSGYKYQILFLGNNYIIAKGFALREQV